MNSTRPLAFLTLPLLLLVSLLPLSAGPSRAQTANLGSKYMFADTTLLRDTLGLSFGGLFPLADSLRMDPAALRSLSISYRWTLQRLVKMSDSLGIPVDSVGPYIERERFNPLANVTRANSFTYTSTYAVSQTTNSWGNVGDYSLTRGLLQIHNSTDVEMTTNMSGSIKSIQQNRNANTDLNWKYSRNLSLGTTLGMVGSDNFSEGGLYNQSTRTNNFGFTLHSAQMPASWATTHVNLQAGFLDDNSSVRTKRGPSGTFQADARLSRPWLNANLRGSLSGDISRLSVPNDDTIPGPNPVRSSSTNRSLSGTIGLWQSAPVGLNLNFSSNQTTNATPGTIRVDTLSLAPLQLRQTTDVLNLPNGTNGLDAEFRVGSGTDRDLKISGHLGSNDSKSQSTVSSQLTSRSATDKKAASHGDYLLGPVRFLGDFMVDRGVNEFPNYDGKGGGYRENTENRTLSGQAQWNPAPFSIQMNANIGLNTYRYLTFGGYTATPTPRDLYSQSYTLSTTYQWAQGKNTTVILLVGRNQTVNLPAGSTASNSETHSYAATWRWNYLLMPGFTATQNNQLRADYLFYPFATSTNRLSLTYDTQTTLIAQLGPRFTVQIDHGATIQPSGSYVPVEGLGPTEYFGLSDQTVTYKLNVTASYRPINAISLSFNPQYLATTRNTTVNGVLGPQRATRQLQFMPSAQVNLPVGAKGKLSGTLGRTSLAYGTQSFNSFSGNQNTVSRQDYWTGNIAFTWTL
jgi:hypothetical protein